MKQQEMVLEVLIDLVLEDVMSGGTLLEANPYHDPHSGKFTSKGAAGAYQSGVMAAGRAEGILAKKKGSDREGIRRAIARGMKKHLEHIKTQEMYRMPARFNRPDAQSLLRVAREKGQPKEGKRWGEGKPHQWFSSTGKE